MQRILFGLLLCGLLGAPAVAAPPNSQTFAFGSRCAYPQGEERDIPDLTPAVRYTTTNDGGMAEAKITISSGIPSADDAAVQCVLRWAFNATESANASIQGTHEVFVAWSDRPQRAAASEVAKVGRPHTCPASPEAKLGFSGVSTVGFKIKTDGNIGDPKILKSSGNSHLDAAALECVLRWRYKPALNNSEPIEVPWKADIVWNADIRPVLERLRSCARSTPMVIPQLSDIDGTTELNVAVQGLDVTSVTITKSSGSEALDHASVNCIAQKAPPGGEAETVIVVVSAVMPAQFTAKVNWKTAFIGRK